MKSEFSNYSVIILLRISAFMGLKKDTTSCTRRLRTGRRSLKRRFALGLAAALGLLLVARGLRPQTQRFATLSNADTAQLQHRTSFHAERSAAQVRRAPSRPAFVVVVGAAASATEASVGGAAPHPLPLRESPLLQLSRLMIDAPMIPTPSLKLAPLNESDLEYGSGSRRRARRHPVYIRLRMDPRTWPARAAVLAGREVKQLRVRVHPPTAKELPRHVVGDKDKDAVDDTDEGDRREMAAAAAGAASVERRARRARARDALVVRDAPTAPFGTFRVIVGGDAGDDIVVGGVAKSAACAPRCAESRAEIPAAPVGDKRKRDGAARNGATLFANVPALCRGINTRLRVRLKGAHLCWGGISADLARATTRVRAMATALPRAPRVRVVFPKGAKGRGFWPPLVANLPPPPPKRSLVNRIVRVRPLVRIDGAARPEDDRRWKYYFTMTYIPDLEWCFLAPLEECGTFGADFGLAVKGRTRWKTVPEGKGRELHLSARRCTLVTANSVVKSKDADAEEWDIREPSF